MGGPIFGMFLVGGALLGFVVLGEATTIKKALGIALGAVAVVLIATTYPIFSAGARSEKRLHLVSVFFVNTERKVIR